ncbi:DNA endonuclease RBBP8-like [Patiria miniata]|uniref:DNA endonuclease activator Ctp1 C-terminal domain-containing protein n=1 Tax=Patiria miniata TaxID=46514 RepID=A0A913ZHZ1_PATMI|nr:DNA endonuclease RBBP8-like [Patiria miniata]XP_038051403.1 DNA endonuclease RBBP8-like [Patiria miniata]
MSSEDGTPQLDESESPEIVTASCSLSSSTSSLTSPPAPRESLTSLLLQIQQYHTTETHKLQERVNRYKMKCNKLAKVSNDNAAIAKQFSKQNKILQAEVMKLKQQLRLLHNTRQNGLVNTSQIQASNAEQASPNQEAHQAPNSPNKDLPKKLFRAPSKLTSKKSNKKVRYEEISSVGSFQKPPAETLQVRNSQEEPSPTAVPNTERPTVHEKTLANFQAPHNRTQVAGSPGGVILAPDTCVSPSVQATLNTRNPDSGATFGGHGTSKQMLDGPGKRIMDKRVHTIPETLGVEADAGTSFEMGDESLIDAPTYASTPVASHSQTSLLSESVSVLSQKSSQMPDSTRLNILSSEASSKQASHSNPLTISIPRSESQFPVDLSNTQAKSPTFCGEGLATPGSSSGKSRQHGSTTVDRNVPTPHRGDRSEVTDESYESEASILLLDPHFPKRVADPRPSPKSLPSLTLTSKTASSGEAKHKQDEGKTLFHAKTQRDSSSTRVLASKVERGQGTDMPLKSHNNLSRVSTSKKRKLDPDESTMNDDTVLPEDRFLEKENSPEGLEDDNQTSIQTSTRQSKQGKRLSPEETGARVQAKGNKNLKQSKLILSKIKPGMNKSASLMRAYNGGSLVNVDSQSDAFMNRAIELSLADRQKAEAGGKNDFRSENIEDGFKVPTLPHKKQQHSVTPDASVAKKASQQKRRASDQDDSDLQESLDFMHSPHDLNDSVDPLMDLTRLETESSQSSSQPNQSVTGGIHVKKLLERRHEAGLEVDDEELMLSEMADDSCQDLFEEEEDSEPEGNLEKSGVGGETSFVRNFDVVPKVVDKPNYKYSEVVRKHDDRQKLKGFGCKECEAFYGDLSLTESQRDKRMKMCSRHRAQFSPPNTPAHYWSVGFPDTQTCLQRGYIKESRSPDRRSRLRGKNKYKKLFSGKEVDGTRQEVEDDN